MKLNPGLGALAASLAMILMLHPACQASERARAEQVAFATKEAAFTQGYSAYRGRNFEIAVPALTFAAARGVVRAKYYLARIYSDNSSGWTDHARAYNLLRDIVQGHTSVDPTDFRVAPFVSRSLTSIARYEREGVPALGLAPSTARAIQFFTHAATYFDDEDAQFELAKHYLSGDGVTMRVPFALNWLAKLSKRGHSGAQAFLAGLYWDGRYTPRDPVRALALITVAVENASDEDRFWIEDVHQNIFCEANDATRTRVRRVVAGWRQKFGREVAHSGEGVLGIASPRRTCANGEVVRPLSGGEEPGPPKPSDEVAAASAETNARIRAAADRARMSRIDSAARSSTDNVMLQGSMVPIMPGFMLRNAGEHPQPSGR